MGSLLSYFWAIVLISAVISNFEDFDSLLYCQRVSWLLRVPSFNVKKWSNNLFEIGFWTYGIKYSENT